MYIENEADKLNIHSKDFIYSGRLFSPIKVMEIATVHAANALTD